MLDLIISLENIESIKLNKNLIDKYKCIDLPCEIIFVYTVKGIYSIMTNISATDNHFRILLMGVFVISLRVNTIIFNILAIVPNRHICNKQKKRKVVEINIINDVKTWNQCKGFIIIFFIYIGMFPGGIELNQLCWFYSLGDLDTNHDLDIM